MKCINIIIMLILLSGAVNVYTQVNEPEVKFDDFSKGPLYGKNYYIPFLIHYNFPSLQAKSAEHFDLQTYFSLYYIQDVLLLADDLPDDHTGRFYDKDYINIDYEGYVIELGFSYNLFKQLQIGIFMRLHSYYGGFLDPVIENFHNFFNFNNAGREFFLQNQLYINIPNNNGILLFLDEPVTSFGDIDLWSKWTFLENKKVSLAALGAFKLPTGKLSALSGSDYPDIALGLLLDFRAFSYATLYTQAGIVLPFNGKSYPMFNGLLGLEVHPWKSLSFNLQMNIKTSPISDDTIYSSWNKRIGTDFFQYSLPQTNILFGAVIYLNNTRLQLYLEEDAFTYQGTDITFGISASHTINLKRNR